jgi:hypothetical protein
MFTRAFVSQIRRSMSVEKLDEMLDVRNLPSLSEGSLLEIMEIEEKTTDDGSKWGLAVYATTLSDGSRQRGRVRLPATAMAQPSLVAPCICLYWGKKTSKNGRSFYDVSAVKAAPDTTTDDLKKMADGLRKLSKRALVACMTTQTLDNFPQNTVFLFKDVKKRKLRKDCEPAVMVSYETLAEDGERLEGTIIVPARYEDEMRRMGSGLMIYRGRKTSQAGRQYNDVCVMSPEVMDGF